MKAFLFVFDQSRMSRDIAITAVNHIDAVKTWHAMFGNTMILAADTSSREPTEKIRAACPDLGFMISEIGLLAKGGWLPEPVWNFVNNPRQVMAESAPC